ERLAVVTARPALYTRHGLPTSISSFASSTSREAAPVQLQGSSGISTAPRASSRRVRIARGSRSMASFAQSATVRGIEPLAALRDRYEVIGLRRGRTTHRHVGCCARTSAPPGATRAERYLRSLAGASPRHRAHE